MCPTHQQVSGILLTHVAALQKHAIKIMKKWQVAGP